MDFTNPVTYGVTLAIIVAAGSFIMLIFRVGEWKGKMNALEGTVGDLKSSIGESLKEIRDNINKIFHALPAQNPAVSSTSPLRLTDLGVSISEEIEAKKWAIHESAMASAYTQKMNPYQVQELCFSYVDGFSFSQDFRTKMERCAYEKGTSLIEVKKVLAIELRDVLLERTPD